MHEAFTVRLRKEAGRVRFCIAPAGGMGLSFPCCSDGHDERHEALECGYRVLAERLNPAAATTQAA